LFIGLNVGPSTDSACDSLPDGGQGPVYAGLWTQTSPNVCSKHADTPDAGECRAERSSGVGGR